MRNSLFLHYDRMELAFLIIYFLQLMQMLVSLLQISYNFSGYQNALKVKNAD